MLNLIITLAESNSYTPLNLDINIPDTAYYVGQPLQDILIVSAFSRNEVMTFFSSENTKAANIMGLYDTILKSEFADSAKDIQLVICHCIDSLSQLDEDIELKHQIMQLEENKYGMRISVLKYTDEALQQLQSEQDITAAINDKVDSSVNAEDAEIAVDKTIDAALKAEPSFTALQLYAKLPFLSLRNFDSESTVEPIDIRLDKIIGKDTELIERILSFKDSEYSSLTAEEFLLKLEGGEL